MAISSRLILSYIFPKLLAMFHNLLFAFFFPSKKTAPYYAIEGVTPYDAIYGLYFCFLGYSLRSTQLKSIRTHNDRFCLKLSKNYKAYFF